MIIFLFYSLTELTNRIKKLLSRIYAKLELRYKILKKKTLAEQTVFKLKNCKMHKYIDVRLSLNFYLLKCI